MSSFTYIENFKKAIEEYSPSSTEYVLSKGYYERYSFCKRHGPICHGDKKSIYHQILASYIAEKNNGPISTIDVSTTLINVYGSCINIITRAVKVNLKKAQLKKNQEIYDWLRKKGNKFSNAYGQTYALFKEQQDVETIFKLGVYIWDRDLSNELRDQMIEVIKLLMAKEKANAGQ